MNRVYFVSKKPF